MTNEQVYYIIKRIKANYSTFRDNDIDVIEEWRSRLSKYNYEEVLNKLENYLEYAKEPPLINDLTEDLSKIDNNQKLDGYIVCSKCGKKYKTYEEVEKCYEKDITLNQINKYCNIFNLDKNKYFKNDTLDELNKNYDKFLLDVIEYQKKTPLLKGKDLQGLRAYYKNVLRSANEK
jgi:hypothetical protein